MNETRITTYLRAYAARRRCSANHKGNMRNAERYLERYEDFPLKEEGFDISNKDLLSLDLKTLEGIEKLFNTRKI